MPRTALTDGSGKWFNSDSAVKFDENTRWDGRNHISVSTGSQWNHEALYYTKSGNWVLNAWSQYQGSLETYEEIEQDEAIRWLCVNECFEREEIEQLPANVREQVQEGIAKSEL